MLSIRKIGGVGKTYRHFMRYQQILGIIFKYGFGNIIDALNIDEYIDIGLQLISRKRRDRVERLSGSERIRMILEELGPTFIKFGQILSARPDLIPFDLLKELSKLQDSVPPFPFDDVVNIISLELGRPVPDIFEMIQEVPLASASIGQVHKAILKGAGEVAVKVQRPGIRKIIEVDLEILHHLATLMEAHIEEIAPHRPVTIVEEFAKSLEKELDYSIEASNIERIARQFSSDPTVRIPGVFREESSGRILTMEYMKGIKISDIQGLLDAGMNLDVITHRGTAFVMKQVFDHGFFHGDPHPGNLFILEGNIICPVDYGIIGFISRAVREALMDLIYALHTKNTQLVVRLLLELAEIDQDPDQKQLEKDITDFINLYLEKPLKDIEIGRLINAILEIAAEHHLRIPPDLFLMMKAFAEIEGVVRTLDPNFDMISASAPFIRAARLSRLSPGRVAEDILDISKDIFRFIKFFPSDLLEILRLARQGKLNVIVRIDDLDKMLVTHDQISNRIAFSIIIAALIMGSALVIHSAVPPIFFGVSLIGIAGFVAAAVMGVWLLVAIIKKGRL